MKMKSHGGFSLGVRYVSAEVAYFSVLELPDLDPTILERLESESINGDMFLTDEVRFPFIEDVIDKSSSSL